MRSEKHSFSIGRQIGRGAKREEHHAVAVADEEGLKPRRPPRPHTNRLDSVRSHSPSQPRQQTHAQPVCPCTHAQPDRRQIQIAPPLARARSPRGKWASCLLLSRSERSGEGWMAPHIITSRSHEMHGTTLHSLPPRPASPPHRTASLAAMSGNGQQADAEGNRAVDTWKVKKLIKSLQQAKGYATIR